MKNAHLDEVPKGILCIVLLHTHIPSASKAGRESFLTSAACFPPALLPPFFGNLAVRATTRTEGCRHRRHRRHYGHGRMGIPTAGKVSRKTKQKQSPRVSDFVCVRACVCVWAALGRARMGLFKRSKLFNLIWAKTMGYNPAPFFPLPPWLGHFKEVAIRTGGMYVHTGHPLSVGHLEGTLISICYSNVTNAVPAARPAAQ
jgi:hypothetical protein